MQPVFTSHKSKVVIDKIAAILLALGVCFSLSQLWDSAYSTIFFWSCYLDSTRSLTSELRTGLSDPSRLLHVQAAEKDLLEAMASAQLNHYEDADQAYGAAVNECAAAFGRLSSLTYLFAITQGRFQAESRHFDEAISLYRGLVNEWRGSARPDRCIDASDSWADALMQQGKLDAAIQIYKENVSASEQLDDRSKALRSLQQRMTLCSLLNSYLKAKRYEDCANCYEKLIKQARLDGNRKEEVVDPLIGLAASRMWFTEKNDYHEVLEPLKEAFKRDPFNIGVSYYIMYACLWAHQYREALIWFLVWLCCCLLSILLPSLLGISRVQPEPTVQAESN